MNPNRLGDNLQVIEKIGTPERIRTSDLLLRRQTLYPAELRVHVNQFYRICADCLVKRHARRRVQGRAMLPFWSQIDCKRAGEVAEWSKAAVC